MSRPRRRPSWTGCFRGPRTGTASTNGERSRACAAGAASRRRGVHLVALAVIVSLATGCADFYDEITLNADGSGSYRLIVIAPVKDPNLTEIRSAAETRAREIAARTGLVLKSVEVGRGEGNLVTIEARADFPNVAVFANPAFSATPAGEAYAWSFVTPRQIVFQEGVFSARVLRGSAPPKLDPFRKRLGGHHARFAVHLPGEVVQAGGAVEGSTVTWRFPLDHLCDEPVEMSARARMPSLTGTLLVGAALLAGLAVMIASLFKKRKA